MFRFALFLSLLLHFVLLSSWQESQIFCEQKAARQGLLRVEVSQSPHFERTFADALLAKSRPGDGRIVPELSGSRKSRLLDSLGSSSAQRSTEKKGQKRYSHAIGGGSEGSATVVTGAVGSADPMSLVLYRLDIARAIRKVSGAELYAGGGAGRLPIVVRLGPSGVTGATRLSLVRPSGDRHIDRVVLSAIEAALVICPLPASLADVAFELQLESRELENLDQ